jgi:hypothetical protein
MLALDLHRARDFRLLDLPFELPPMEVKVHSHSRFANDTGIKWMCQTSAAILRKSTDGAHAKMNGRWPIAIGVPVLVEAQRSHFRGSKRVEKAAAGTVSR